MDFTANLEVYKQTYIVPSITARIEKLNVDVGDKVEKGQILAEMDKTQYNTNALQLANAELDFARMKPVYETGRDFQAGDRCGRDQYQCLEGDRIESGGERNAPQSVRRRGNGALQRGGATLFSSMSGTGIYQVMQMDPLKAYVFVSEQYFPQVYIGMPVEVKVDVSGPGILR